MISNLRFKYQCDNRTDMNELSQTDYGDNILINHVATVVNYNYISIFMYIIFNRMFFLGRFEKMYPRNAPKSTSA